MRTTLTIDDDVLNAATAMADQQGKPLGDTISALAESGLARLKPEGSRNLIPVLLLGPRAAPVTLAIVNRLRDE